MAKVKRVFVTRPSHQNVPWRARLERMGVGLVEIPLLGIEPVSDTEQIEKIKQQVLRLDEYRILIFVSQNAVQHAFTWIERYWPQFPVELQLLSIGAKTEKCLREQYQDLYDSPVSFIGVADNSEMSSEDLLSEISEQELQNVKVLVFRGVGGRTKIKDELQARGAKVEHCELYWRTLPQTAGEQMATAKISSQGDLVTVFSGETLQNLHLVLRKLKIENWQSIPLLVPSHRVAMMGRELGFNHVVNALNASEEHMWNALHNLISSS